MKNIPFDVYKYTSHNCWRSLVEIALTFALIIVGILALYKAVTTNNWPFFILVVPLGFLFVRLFIIQHDLGHGTLFKKKKTNDWVGVFMGIILLTPFYYWQKAHMIHHVSGGNTNKRPWVGDIKLLSVREYEAKNRWGKWLYQLYRNSFVMFFFGSIYLFMIDQRFFLKRKGFGKKEWQSVVVTNLCALILYGFLLTIGGMKFFLIAIVLPQWLGGVIGIYLFYVQHNFKHRYFVTSQEWNLQDSALKGSTFYELPQPFKWLTANIGYHHVHTLVPSIPFYNLPKCHEENPIFHNAPRFGLKDMKELTSLKLYDEIKGQMITWNEYKAQYPKFGS